MTGRLFEAIRIIAIFFTAGMSLSAHAGLFGFGGESWKEEALQPDGSTIIVMRSQHYGGNHEIGQTPPISDQEISFVLPSSGKMISFKSKYGQDIGRSNFRLLSLDIVKNTPYIVAEPYLCLSYNKWGRPNPPYVVFRYDGNEWKRIPLSELPGEVKEFNLVIETKGYMDDIKEHSPVTAETVRKLNGELPGPEYRSILREPVKSGITSCETMVFYKCGWIDPRGSIGRNFMDATCKGK